MSGNRSGMVQEIPLTFCKDDGRPASIDLTAETPVHKLWLNHFHKSPAVLLGTSHKYESFLGDCWRASEPSPPQGLLSKALDGMASHRRLLVVHSDHTRVHSGPGELTRYAWNCYHERLKAILSALGTHAPITEDQLRQMFGAIPECFFTYTTGAGRLRLWDGNGPR